MLIDTNIIVEILINDINSNIFKEIEKNIKDEQLFISSIQLAEISDWCIRENETIEDKIEEIKKIATIIPLNEKILIKGAKIKHKIREHFKNEMEEGKISKDEYERKKNFGLIDGLIIASARSLNQKILTIDEHFLVDCIENVVFIDKEKI